MKKNNRILFFVVGIMMSTMLIACGDKAEPVTETVVETSQEETTEVGTVEETTTEEGMDDSLDIINTDGKFYGLEITPSGVEKKIIWQEKNQTNPEINTPVTAEVSTTVNADGMYEKSVTYRFAPSNSGELIIRIFDYATGEDLMYKEGNTISVKKEESCNDATVEMKELTVTIITPEENDSVFFFTQDATSFENSMYDTSYFIEHACISADFQEFLDSCKLSEDIIISDYIHLTRD